MNILILNWRDPLNPLAGGAEKLNMRILAPLVKRGDKVTWYAMNSKGLPQLQYYESIKIVRFGNKITHFLLWPLLLWSGRFGKVDLIIDSIHGTGYYSPLFAPRTNRIVLICEVAKNIWDEMYTFPVNKIGKLIEKQVMFRFYLNDQFWTISKSTKDDMISLGIKEKNITILRMGFDAPKNFTKLPKYKTPTAIFVGRLAEMKGIKDAILAIAEVNKESQNKWRLNIIGKGERDYEKQLQLLVKEVGMQRYIKFMGFVDETTKFEEISKSWIMLVPSSREGWGMIVSEANYVGTKVMAYRSPGLTESVLSSKENILIDQSVVDMYTEISKVEVSKSLRTTLKPGWDMLQKQIVKSL